MKRERFKPPPAAMLTHFTRASARASALDNLVGILRDGCLRASSRMIRGRRPVVCLFDAALSELGPALNRRNRKRYEPFGVAVDKRYAFKMGARPVIYLPWEEARRVLKEEELWRIVRLEMDRNPPVDWSFEREWRVGGDLPFPAVRAVALVPGWRDVEEVFDRFDGHPPCAGVIPLDEVLAGS